MAGEGVHGGIEVVFVEVLVTGKSAGGREQGALGGVFEGEFRTREVRWTPKIGPVDKAGNQRLKGNALCCGNALNTMHVSFG